jgi:hypothetical protein
VRAVTRQATRDRILQTAGWYLGRDEIVVRVARVWVTDVGRLPVMLRQRSFYDLVLTDQRFVLLARPRRFHPPWRRRRPAPEGPLVAKRLSAFELVHVRKVGLLFQVRVHYSGASDLVLEFRPFDRGAARDLVAGIRALGAAAPAA